MDNRDAAVARRPILQLSTLDELPKAAPTDLRHALAAIGELGERLFGPKRMRRAHRRISPTLRGPRRRESGSPRTAQRRGAKRGGRARPRLDDEPDLAVTGAPA